MPLVVGGFSVGTPRTKPRRSYLQDHAGLAGFGVSRHAARDYLAQRVVYKGEPVVAAMRDSRSAAAAARWRFDAARRELEAAEFAERRAAATMLSVSRPQHASKDKDVRSPFHADISEHRWWSKPTTSTPRGLSPSMNRSSSAPPAYFSSGADAADASSYSSSSFRPEASLAGTKVSVWERLSRPNWARPDGGGPGSWAHRPDYGGYSAKAAASSAASSVKAAAAATPDGSQPSAFHPSQDNGASHAATVASAASPEPKPPHRWQDRASFYLDLADRDPDDPRHPFDPVIADPRWRPVRWTDGRAQWRARQFAKSHGDYRRTAAFATAAAADQWRKIQRTPHCISTPRALSSGSTPTGLARGAALGTGRTELGMGRTGLSTGRTERRGTPRSTPRMRNTPRGSARTVPVRAVGDPTYVGPEASNKSAASSTPRRQGSVAAAVSAFFPRSQSHPSQHQARGSTPRSSRLGTPRSSRKGTLRSVRRDPNYVLAGFIMPVHI